MKCPNCPDVTLVMADRQGVEIDYCPSCRGVWLDRGELDKLIERSLALQPQQQVQQPQPVQQQPVAQPHAAPPRHGHRDFDDSDFGHRQGGYRKRKSWLSDIFD